jgi:hypothetical protein
LLNSRQAGFFRSSENYVELDIFQGSGVGGIGGGFILSPQFTESASCLILEK